MSEYKIIRFEADWCGPCKRLGPIIQKLEKEYTNIVFENINVDSGDPKVEEFKVRSVPMLVLLKNNEKVSELIGFKTEKELKDFIKENSE
jgi:thioredoxin 1